MTHVVEVGIVSFYYTLLWVLFSWYNYRLRDKFSHKLHFASNYQGHMVVMEYAGLTYLWLAIIRCLDDFLPVFKKTTASIQYCMTATARYENTNIIGFSVSLFRCIAQLPNDPCVCVSKYLLLRSSVF